MKKNLLAVTVFCGIIILLNQSRAQVGIGTISPDASSILDLTSTTSGMLVPRMTESQKTSISGTATGLLIYQTDQSNGFWYYDGSGWRKLTAGGWMTTGNSETIDGTNFLGTTDDIPLTIKVNNEKSGRIGNSTEGNTSLGYRAGNNNTFNGSTFLGYNAGLNNTSGSGNCSIGWSALMSNTTGFNNTAVGYYGLKANTTGFDNSAFGMNALYALKTGGQNSATGSNALYALTSGNGNSAFGQNALYTDTSGSYNSAVGVNSLRLLTNGGRNVAAGYNSLSTLTTGGYNTGLGYAAGNTVTTGSNNTFVGSNADASSGTLSNATAIGYYATVGANNSFVLGGSGAYLVKVGIGVSSPTNSLSFDGTSARTVGMERHTSAGNAGNNFIFQSGGAYSGGTNLNGGDLIISSGIATGTGSSNIYFKSAASGSSGTSDNTPSTKLTITGSGNVGVGTTSPNSTLHVSGSVSHYYQTKSGSYTFTSSDYSLINTGSSATWTLPAASSCPGRVYIITNHGTGSITTSVAYRTANGSTSTTVSVATSVQLISDGSEWRKIN